MVDEAPQARHPHLCLPALVLPFLFVVALKEGHLASFTVSFETTVLTVGFSVVHLWASRVHRHIFFCEP